MHDICMGSYKQFMNRALGICLVLSLLPTADSSSCYLQKSCLSVSLWNWPARQFPRKHNQFIAPLLRTNSKTGLVNVKKNTGKSGTQRSKEQQDCWPTSAPPSPLRDSLRWPFPRTVPSSSTIQAPYPEPIVIPTSATVLLKHLSKGFDIW